MSTAAYERSCLAIHPKYNPNCSRFRSIHCLYTKKLEQSKSRIDEPELSQHHEQY